MRSRITSLDANSQSGCIRPLDIGAITVNNTKMRLIISATSLHEGGTRQPRRVTQRSLVRRVTRPGATSEKS